MRSFILAWVLGCYGLQQQAALPPHPGLILALLGVLALGGLVRPNWFKPWYCRLPLAAAGGFFWAASLATWALSSALPINLEGKDLILRGTVSSLPNRFEGGVRFQFEVEQARMNAPEAPDASDAPRHHNPRMAQVPRHIVLGWYGEQVVLPGERWELTVRLQRPHGQANPYGFDYELWLLEQGIRATGYVREKGSHRRLDAFVFSPGNSLALARERLRQRIFAALPDARYAPVLVALVLGDQRAVNQTDWALFNRTGISHLVSISGLHITMIAGLFASVLGALWRRSFFTRAQLPLLIPAQKVAALAAVLSGAAYVALAGFGVPAQRTLIMLSVAALALWLGRTSSASHVLCSALGLVVLLDPWAVMAPGFWLSFAAVGLIFYASTGRIELAMNGVNLLWANLKSALHIQYVMTLGLLPLTVFLFNQFSVVGPIANALAIPIISFIVTPLALLGSIAPGPLCPWLLELAHAVFAFLAQCLQWLSQRSFAVWSAPQPALWMFILACFGMMWLLAPRAWPARWAGPLLCLPLLLNRPTQPPEGALWVTAFDIGQGNALLLETAHHRLMYDTGTMYSPLSDGGNRVLVPYLKARGIQSLDGLMVSHRDLDHVGGALSLLQSLPVGWLSSSLEWEHPVIAAAASHQRCLAGQRWSWDGVQFEILHPTPEIYADPHAKPNTQSCTLKVTSTHGSILLAGDIEAAQEAQLLESSRARLPATVLLAPHHGSGTSSTPAFLQAVQPQMALFQVGHRNRYRHPKAQVFERYRSMGITRLRTDESGAISLRFEPDLRSNAGAQAIWSSYRATHARYWYGR
jgi:competence protein ComEC